VQGSFDYVADGVPAVGADGTQAAYSRAAPMSPASPAAPAVSNARAIGDGAHAQQQEHAEPSTFWKVLTCRCA
jgi:hypothetical protein